VKIETTEIPDVKHIEPRVFGDDRGFFLEMWRAERLGEMGIDAPLIQVNHSRSSRGVLRGLHYQIRQPQGKLVSVINGAIFDVAVDVRRNSDTYGRWVGRELSDRNSAMLWIPKGFAHGFLTLSDSADVLYACTDYYSPDGERAIIWNDPDLGIAWPLDNGLKPIVSGKDRQGSPFSAAEVFP